MKISTSIIILSVASLAACSSGGEMSSSGANATNTSNTPNAATVSNDREDTLKTSVGELPSVSEYPTNAELTAVNGVPDIAAARVLIQGQWNAIDGATQCVTSYAFDDVGSFTHSELDRRGAGKYDVYVEGSGLELDLDYDSENFQSDCRGFIEDSDALELGISFAWGLTFPDQNTMVFSSGSGFGGGRPIHTFTRQ